MASLNLTFDNITNADLLVGDSTDYNDWNTFFDLPIYGNPFTGVTVTGSTIQLFGGSDIEVKELLWGYDYPHLISVIDGGSITSVGVYGFGLMTNLQSINLPNCLTAGESAFDSNPNLTNINIPNLITAGDYCFGTLNLSTISLPNLTTAGNGCFYQCTSLTAVDLPNLTTAGSSCFYQCTSLTAVDLPNLTTAGSFCFYQCTSLTTINIPSCTNLGGTVGDDNVFAGINGNTITLTIPPGLMICNSGSPDGDIQYLQSNNTVTINDSPFINPNALNLQFDFISSANLLVGDASVVGDWNTFFDLPTYGTPFSAVTISGSTVQLFGGSNIKARTLLLYNYNFNTFLISIIDNAGCLTSIGGDSFTYCYGLTTVSLPACTTIYGYQDSPEEGGGGFQYCVNLVNVYAPLLETIGDQGFGMCSSLVEISFPLLFSVGIAGFIYCTSLTTINIPSCTDLGGTIGDDNVFNGITGNTITLTIPPGLMTCNSGSPDGDIQYLQANNTVILGIIDPNALNLVFDSIANADLLVGDASDYTDWNTFFDLPTYGTPFSAVTISGETVQLFGGSGIKVKPGLMYDYNYNTFLISIIDSVGSITSVGGDAFTYCYGLTTVDLPACTIVYGFQDSPITNDFGGFGNCQNLINLSIPLLEEAGDYAFGICTSLLEISFPLLFSGGNNCFNNCTSLTTVVLPNLTTAGDNCFYICTSLSTVNLPNLTTAGQYCFYQCTSLTTINLPSLTTAGQYCFSNCTSLTTINIPSCTDLGGTVGDDNVFNGINGNTITLTVLPELMTCNSGSPDGDIQYLQANNTVTVIEVTPQPTPLPSPTPSSSPLPPVPPGPSPTPSPSFVAQIIDVNSFYAYTPEMFGVYSGGTIAPPPPGLVLPHPAMLGNDGNIYVQLNAIQIGGFNGLNN